ncbi:MAG: glycosyltransferase family 39 protein, partial [Acidobacteriota bacterium]
ALPRRRTASPWETVNNFAGATALGVLRRSRATHGFKKIRFLAKELCLREGIAPAQGLRSATQGKGGCTVQAIRRSSRYLEVSLVLTILSVAFVVRFTHLDADPSALISRDFITDEGQWAHNVRNTLAFGKWQVDGYNPAPYSAYLYHQLLLFEVTTFGLSLTTLRMVSAVFGWLTVVVLFVWIRRETNMRTAIFAITFLGLSNLHVLYSRTGFVESTLVFFLVLMLWLWSLRQKHIAFGFLAGVAFGLMLLTKVTAIYIVPGLALWAAAEAIRKTTVKRDALMFFCGAALAGAIYTIGFIGPHLNDWLGYNLASGLDNEFPTRISDLASAVLRVIVWKLYARTPILTALTLVALGGVIIRISSIGLKNAIRQTSNIEIASLSLLLGYLFSIGLTVYQPERRFIPALLMMVVLSANVLDKGWTWVEEIADGRTMVRAGGWFAVLFALPAIAIVEIKVAKAGLLSSIAFGMLKAAAIVLLLVISRAISHTVGLSRLKRMLVTGSRVIFVVAFSALSLGLVYQSLTLLGFKAFELRTGRFAMPAMLMLAAVAIVVAMWRKPQVASIVMAAFIFIEGVQVASWLARPTYTLKEANSILAGLIGTEQTVVTNYETLLVTSGAKVVCYWPKAGFNVDAFERFNPDYILILRRDNWKDYAFTEMPGDEWPPPTQRAPILIARFDLCPTPVRGPRFSLELYSLK